MLQETNFTLPDSFMESMAASMESNSNSSTINNSNSHKGGNMETASNSNASNSNASNSNSKGNGRKANSKANSKGNGKRNSKANSNASNATPTLPETLPAVANAGISAKGLEQDAATSLLFQYHIRQALQAYGGAASICQVYNYLRGDSPLRLEKDGTPKQDNLPRWRGLGSSKLFRANTEGTLLTYTHKVCSNGRIRSVAVAGPTLQEFPSK